MADVIETYQMAHTGAEIDAAVDAVAGKAPTSHASSATTYGLGTGSYYGHVKLSDSTTGTSGTGGGIAATPAAVNAVSTKIETINGKIKSVSGTLPYADWVDANGSKTGTVAPFTQTITASGITSDWNPGVLQSIQVSPGYRGSTVIESIQQQTGLITLVESYDNALTFVCCSSKPTWDLTIKIPGVI